MKYYLVLILLALAPVSFAQEFFSGTVDVMEQEGERIVIDGGEYRITGKAKVTVGEHKVSLDYVAPGTRVLYALDYSVSQGKLIKALKLQVTEEQAAEMFNN